MTKRCFNYESGEFENIDENGYSYDRNEFVHSLDDSEYRREAAQKREEQEQSEEEGRRVYRKRWY